MGVREDLHPHVADNPGYRAIFYEAPPEALHAPGDEDEAALRESASEGG